MNISELNDQDLSRWIADMFEPLSTLEPMPSNRIDKEEFPDISPLRFWILSTRPEWHWAACDMVNDPAMTVMLMEKMRTMEFSIALYPSAVHWKVMPWGHHVSHAAIGRSIAEAFALANGWKG